MTLSDKIKEPILKINKLLRKNYLTKAFSSFSIAQGINAIVGFVILSIYSKYLLPDEFGKISLIWIFITIISVFIDARLNTAFSIKYYKSDTVQVKRNLYTALIFNTTALFVFFGIFILFPSLFKIAVGFQMPNIKLGIIFALVYVMLISNFYTNLLMLSKKPKQYLQMNILFNSVLLLSTILFLIVLEHGYMAYIESYLLSYLSLSLIGLRYFTVVYKLKYLEMFCTKNLKSLLLIGVPLIPAGLLLMSLAWGNRYVLNFYSGLSVVGIYYLGSRFADVIDRFISNPFGQAMTPVLYKQFAQDINAYRNTMSNIFKYYWLFMLVLLVIYLVVLKDFYYMFVGEKYSAGFNIIPILVVGLIFNGINGVLGTTILLKEKTKNMLWITGTTVIVSILLNLALVPKMNLYGAAIASLISYALQFSILLIYSQKLIFVSFDYKCVIKSFVISSIFITIIMLLSNSNIFNHSLIILFKIGFLLLYFVVIYKVFSLKGIFKGVVEYAKAG